MHQPVSCRLFVDPLDFLKERGSHAARTANPTRHLADMLPADAEGFGHPAEQAAVEKRLSQRRVAARGGTFGTRAFGTHAPNSSQRCATLSSAFFGRCRLKDLISAIRQSLRLSKAGFADRLGVSVSALGNWERGRNRPHPDHLRKMAELAPRFAAQIDRELEEYEWHRGDVHPSRSTGRRYGPETRAGLIQGIDIILEWGPTEYIAALRDFIEERAARSKELRDSAPARRAPQGEPARSRRK